MPTGTKGIWPKARLWGARLGDLEGPVLFMDLDLVVVGPLDGFFSFGDPDEVILARNPNTPLERLGQTSIFRFPVGKLLPLQEKFVADPQGVADAYRFEQRFVTREAPGGVAFWPEPWVRHFRFALRAAAAAQLLPAAEVPKGAKVVIFPGGLLPPHAIAGRWGRALPADDAGRAPARALRRGPARPAAALPAPLPAAGALGRRGLARVAAIWAICGMHRACTTYPRETRHAIVKQSGFRAGSGLAPTAPCDELSDAASIRSKRASARESRPDKPAVQWTAGRAVARSASAEGEGGAAWTVGLQSGRGRPGWPRNRGRPPQGRPRPDLSTVKIRQAASSPQEDQAGRCRSRREESGQKAVGVGSRSQVSARAVRAKGRGFGDGAGR